jgi:hypothetical protein
MGRAWGTTSLACRCDQGGEEVGRLCRWKDPTEAQGETLIFVLEESSACKLASTCTSVSEMKGEMKMKKFLFAIVTLMIAAFPTIGMAENKRITSLIVSLDDDGNLECSVSSFRGLDSFSNKEENIKVVNRRPAFCHRSNHCYRRSSSTISVSAIYTALRFDRLDEQVEAK